LVTLATINVVGGFAVTERMLKMFKPRIKPTGSSNGTGKS
jgi:NAD/NADP transhydrogenase alpha subunit